MKHFAKSQGGSSRRYIAMLMVVATLLGLVMTTAIPGIGAIASHDSRSAQNAETELYLSVDFDSDSTGNVYTGGFVSIPVSGLYGTALSITDGGHTGSALTAGTAAIVEDIDYQFCEGHSISLWVSGKAADGTSVLFAKGEKISGHFEIYTRSGSLYFYAPDLGDHAMGFNINSLGDGWHNLVFSRKEGKLVTYADGRQVASILLAGTIAETRADFAVGALTENSLIFAGSIDDVHLYNRLLSDEEIAANAGYEGGDESETEPDEILGTDVIGPDIGANIVGKQMTTDFDFPNGSTINLWLNTATDQRAVLFAKDIKASPRHFEIFANEGQLHMYGPGVNYGAPISLQVDLNTYAGSWHMLTIVHENDRFNVYMDGVLQDSVGANFAPELGRADCAVGRLVEGGLDFNGSLADVEVLNEALTPEDIRERLDNKNVTLVPPLDPGVTMCVIGDSFTDIRSYIPQLKEAMSLDAIYCYGISGSCIGGSSPTAFWQRYSLMRESCDMVLIQGGTNDYGYSIPLGEADDTNADTFYGALKILLSGIKEKYPTQPIVITTPSQRNWNGDSPNYTKDEVGVNAEAHTLIEYVEAIRRVAAEYDIIVADLYADCGITKENATQYTTDGLHPNEVGGAMIAECIAKAFGEAEPPETDPETNPETDPETSPETDLEVNSGTEPETRPLDTTPDTGSDTENLNRESDSSMSNEDSSDSEAEHGGCQSLLAIPALVMITMCGALWLRKRKEV